MHRRLIAIAFALATRAAAQSADNPILTRAAAEDVAARTGGGTITGDSARLRTVLEQVALNAVVTPADKAHAALVLQHSPLMWRGEDLVAVSPDNYLLAHLYAKQAYEAGFTDARYLVAQTIDRYLSFTTGVIATMSTGP